MARPERFELPTAWFVARYSIQLSYGREERGLSRDYGGVSIDIFKDFIIELVACFESVYL